MKLLTSLIFPLSEQRGQYEGERRGLDIKLNSGKRKNEIINKALETLSRRYDQYEEVHMDKARTTAQFEGIFKRTYPTFMSIYFYPIVNDKAVLVTRAPSLVGSIALPGKRKVSYDPEEMRPSGEVRLSNDLATLILSDAFYKVLLTDLEGFGLTHHQEKTQRVNISLPKSIRSVGEEEEVNLDATEELGNVVVKSDPYITGNVHLDFVEPIRGQDLREYLAMKGYDVGHGVADDDESEEELKEQKEFKRLNYEWFEKWFSELLELDTLKNYYYKGRSQQIAKYLISKYKLYKWQQNELEAAVIQFFENEESQKKSEHLEEQAIYKQDAGEGEEDNDITGSTASTPNVAEPAIFKTKKAVVVDNVEKLMRSIDDFAAIVKEHPEIELSDLVSVFSDLENKLAEVGLIGKEE